MNVFIDKVRNIARCAWIINPTDKTWALIHTRVTSVAVVNYLLKSRDIPSTDEIAVQRVSCFITVGQDERLRALALSPHICEQGRVPVHLIEYMRRVNPALRTVLQVSARGGKCHILLVVIEARGGVIA